MRLSHLEQNKVNQNCRNFFKMFGCSCDLCCRQEIGTLQCRLSTVQQQYVEVCLAKQELEEEKRGNNEPQVYRILSLSFPSFSVSQTSSGNTAQTLTNPQENRANRVLKVLLSIDLSLSLFIIYPSFYPSYSLNLFLFLLLLFFCLAPSFSPHFSLPSSLPFLPLSFPSSLSPSLSLSLSLSLPHSLSLSLPPLYPLSHSLSLSLSLSLSSEYQYCYPNRYFTRERFK